MFSWTISEQHAAQPTTWNKSFGELRLEEVVVVAEKAFIVLDRDDEGQK